MSDTLWVVDDVAAYLQVSRATIYRLVRSGQLPALRPHSDLRFIPEEVAAWVESRRVTA